VYSYVYLDNTISALFRYSSKASTAIIGYRP